jgi:hypothetical protein
MAFRLADKPFAHVGRLEARYHGTWGAVCADNIDLRDAHVICRMAGYSKAVTFLKQVKRVSAIRFSITMNCNGNENSTEQCRNVHFNQINSCSSDQDVQIFCQPASGNAKYCLCYRINSNIPSYLST